MKNKNKKLKTNFISIFSALSLLALAFIMLASFCFGAFRVAPLRTYADCASASQAKAMCLIEAGSGRILTEKNSNARLPMASTTKIMTAITAIENCDNLDEVFEVSPKAIGVSGTSLYLREGEKHSLRDLLYGLMLVSGNDASVAIGERVGGSTEHFVDLMNFTAHRLGAKNTHFENTHGLDEEGHYTSASDLAHIAAYALKNSTFREIASTQNKKITSAEGKNRYLCNKNKLLQTFDGAIGVKTGFTDDAGRCLVAAAERNGMTLVAVVLNCRPMFEECTSLLEWGFENYSLCNLTNLVKLPQTIKVESGSTDSVKIGHNENFVYPLTKNELERVRVSINLAQSIAPIKNEGTKVGEFEIMFDNNLLFSGKIVTMEKVKARSYLQRMQDIFDQW